MERPGEVGVGNLVDLVYRGARKTGSCGPRTIATHVAPTINAAAARADRPPPRIVAPVGVCVTDDPDAVRAQSREHSVMYDSFPSYRATARHDQERLATREALANAR